MPSTAGKRRCGGRSAYRRFDSRHDARPRRRHRHGGGGEYTATTGPGASAFTWTWDGDDESRRQLIEIEFVDHGEQTTVILTNRGVPDPEVADHRNGWENAFDNLAEALRS